MDWRWREEEIGQRQKIHIMSQSHAAAWRGHHWKNREQHATAWGTSFKNLRATCCGMKHLWRGMTRGQENCPNPSCCGMNYPCRGMRKVNRKKILIMPWHAKPMPRHEGKIWVKIPQVLPLLSFSLKFKNIQPPIPSLLSTSHSINSINSHPTSQFP